MSDDPSTPFPDDPDPTVRRIRNLKAPFVFALTLLLGVVGGWFVHKLVDMERVPWQAMVRTLIVLVVLMVLGALLARVVFKMVIATSMNSLKEGMGDAADKIRRSPQALASPAFWLDEVWPTLREAKSVAFAWIGVYGTMTAVVALTALLCQTGSLAVSYLQIDRLDKQNEKLERQTKLMEQQTSQSEAQNKLLETQNTLLESQNVLMGDQNLLSESARRAALLQIVGDVLAAIDAETKAEKDEEVTGIRNQPGLGGGSAQMTHSANERLYRVASPRLLGRLAAACSSLRGYRYLGDDGKPVETPRSPERGFVLRSLISAGIDITGLIDQRADFSYAEVSNATMDYFRLEPTPIAASSAPGARGLILKNSWLGGTSFRGARLGEANFEKATLHDCSFAGARLCGSLFMDATASRSNFMGTDLRDSSFTGAQLFDADFSSDPALGDTLLPIPEAFKRANLEEVYLLGAFVTQENWLEQLEKLSLGGGIRLSKFRKGILEHHSG